MRKPSHPCFSERNDPIPNGEKPRWVSTKTGKPVDTDPTRIPDGFNRWLHGRPGTRGTVMMMLCTVGQYRFKAKMDFLAQKCGMTDRNLRRCIADLEAGGWITRKFRKRGGTLWGWNLFTLPHLVAHAKPPAHEGTVKSDMD